MRRLEQPGPGAGFATRAEMRRYAWTEEAFYFGKTAPEVAGVPSFDVGMPEDDDRAIFLTAGSRGGKSTGIIVNNLIGWPGGAVCLDPKGELASLTALRRGRGIAAAGSGTSVRHFLGQNVAVLDPMGEVKGPARLYLRDYNPLADLDPYAPGFIGELRNIARALVIEEQAGNARHFTDMAAILLAGVLQVVMLEEPPDRRNLVRARHIMVGGKTRDYLARAPDEELVQEALGALEVVGSNEGGGFHTTLVRQWAWLADPRMQASVQDRSGFSLRRLVQRGGTVYLSIPFNELHNQNRWMRLMLTMALWARLQMGAIRQAGRQTLFVVDEMAALGPMPMLEQGMGYMAGFGIKAVCVVQNVGQLKKLYQDNWQTFIGNTGAVVGFSFGEPESMAFYAQLLGSYEFMEESYSESSSESTPQWTGNRGLFGGGVKASDHEARASRQTTSNRSTSRKIEPVLRPEQVRERTSREEERMLVVPASGRPMLLQRVDYWHRFTPEWYEDPDNILAIERRIARTRRG